MPCKPLNQSDSKSALHVRSAIRLHASYVCVNVDETESNI